jgi:hypothetical protein
MADGAETEGKAEISLADGCGRDSSRFVRLAEAVIALSVGEHRVLAIVERRRTAR